MHLVDWIETDEFYFQSFWMMRVESKNSSKEKFGQEYYWDFKKKRFCHLESLQGCLALEVRQLGLKTIFAISFPLLLQLLFKSYKLW
jgi:hypothetical protein